MTLIIPPEVVAWATRAGVSTRRASTLVRFSQAGTMRNDAKSRWARFTAHQTMQVHTTAFNWHARTGPLNALSVTDGLAETHAELRVRAIGLFTIARLHDTPALLKGQSLRYLAELPLAPEAILHNAALQWSVASAQEFRVRLHAAPERGEVLFTMGVDGLAAAVCARDRPRAVGDAFVETPWFGRFNDYRSLDGMQIPCRAEVGWLAPRGEELVWRGSVPGPGSATL